MPDVLIHTDASENSAHAAAWNTAKADVQQILNLYNAMELPPLTALEFPQLFNDTETLIYDKYTGGDVFITSPSNNNLPVDKAKAMEILIKPAGYDALLTAIANLKKKTTGEAYSMGNARGRVSYDVKSIAQYFTLESAEVIGLAASVTAAVDKAGKHYAKSAKAKAAFAFAQAVSTAFYANGLHQFFGDKPSPFLLPELVGKCIERLDYPNSGFTVNLRGMNEFERF